MKEDETLDSGSWHFPSPCFSLSLLAHLFKYREEGIGVKGILVS